MLNQAGLGPDQWDKESENPTSLSHVPGFAELKSRGHPSQPKRACKKLRTPPKQTGKPESAGCAALKLQKTYAL
ncbi:hypothetical protein KaCgl_12470 [Corynebacterium glutamicum]|nr:hypothetical protein KaCgl_12470 [Corynebacterium glutamicum]